jgi:hypothetical protein
MVPTLHQKVRHQQTSKHLFPVLFDREKQTILEYERGSDGTIPPGPPIARETHLSGSGTTPAAMRCDAAREVGALSPARLLTTAEPDATPSLVGLVRAQDRSSRPGQQLPLLRVGDPAVIVPPPVGAEAKT